MSTYELWTLIISVLALGIAALSYARSIRAEKLAREANDISARQLRESSTLSTPNLILDPTVFFDGTRADVRITIFNAGSHVTQIKEGEIKFQSYRHPEAGKLYHLRGQKIAGGGQHLMQFETKAAVIYSAGAGIGPTEIIFKALYSRPDQDDGEANEKYIFDDDKKHFTPA